MKKDNIRDYATSAFATYAKYGRRNEQEVRELIYHSELKKHDRPDIAVKRAEEEVSRNYALLMDIAAVDKTIDLLKKCGDPNRLKAVEAVYLDCSPIRKQEISRRVRKIAYELPVGERTVYRWLKEARIIFAELRSLNVSESWQ